MRASFRLRSSWQFRWHTIFVAALFVTGCCGGRSASELTSPEIEDPESQEGHADIYHPKSSPPWNKEDIPPNSTWVDLELKQGQWNLMLLPSLRTNPEREEGLNRDGDAATNGSGVTGADGTAVGGGKVDTGDVEETAGARRRKKKSLEEWATAARKRGRVDTPVPPTLPSSTPESPFPCGAQGNGNSKNSSNSNNSASRRSGSILLTPHDLESARARVHHALVAGNVTDTLEISQQILQEWPHDGTALLYQGAAMAQSGEWDVAWNRMERVLALSRGVEEIPARTAALGTAGSPADDSDSARGHARGSARLDATAKPSVTAEAEVPLNIALAAAANLASFSGSRARENLDPNAETFFLVEGLRGNTGWNHVGTGRRMTGNRTSTATSPSNRDTAGDDEGSNGRGYHEVERIDSYTNLLVMMAHALEGKGQLTSALRLYQRAVLLGSHRDQRALHGIGRLSRRLLEVEREKTRRRGTTGGEASPTHSSILSPLSLPTSLTGENTTTTSTGAPGAVAPSRKTQRRERGASCEWGISHPRPDQIFSPDDSVQVEFDLTLLDPGLPSAGSLFETFAIRAAAGGSFSAKDVQENGGSGSIVQDGLGVVVCSYLEGFKAANCLPSGQMRGVGLGWHLLTAEAYQLPSLAPFSCPASAGDDSAGYSTKTVRFCVGDAATTCSAAAAGEGEYNSPSSRNADAAADVGSASARQSNSDKSSVLNGRDSVGAFEAGRDSSSKDSGSQGGVAEDAWTEMRAPPSTRDREEDEQAIELPFCFMTLALNAMPFITHHAPVFDEVGQILSKRAQGTKSSRPGGGYNPDCKRTPPPQPPRPEAFWRWHVVEGVASGRADHEDPYSRRRIPRRYFDPATGLSVDGTTQYLDEVAASGDSVGGDDSSSAPARMVHIHRRCGHGKRPGSRLAREGGTGEPAGSQSSERLAPGSPGAPGSVAAHPETAGRKSGNHELLGDGVGGRGEGFGVDDYGGDDDDDDGPTSCLWRDKIQMVNAVAFSLESECLLVQIDADELWTADQLVRLRDMFLLERNRSGEDGDGGENATREGVEQHAVSEVSGAVTDVEGGTDKGSFGNDQDFHVQRQRQQPYHQDQNDNHQRKRECAYFDCHFFIGPDLVTVTENGWGHSTSSEWLRAWVFRPRESVWLRHAPPELARHDEATGWNLLAGDQCIGREETRERGLVFTHYAYVLEEQVRFKDEFYGHSEMGATSSTPIPVDTVAEWRDLQSATPPVRLADHLTWLRIQGETGDPRLLVTVADRPSPSVAFGRESSTTSTGGGGASFAVPSAVPLEPFLQTKDVRESDYTNGLWRRAGGKSQTGDAKRRRSRLTHGVHTVLKEHRSGEQRLPGSRRWAGDEEEEGRRAASTGEASAAPRTCGLLHLVVDGVVFQVQAARPTGIARVWANVLPAMLDRLSEFDGTCVTLLVRGLGLPPPAISEAFSRLSSERFVVKQLPPYNPFFGFVADRLMLSWAVRSAKATAFVSTLYTQPLWATTPGVVRLLLVHDVIPEVLGWDMSSAECLEKSNAVAVASSIVAISQHTAKGFLHAYPPPAGDSGDTARARPVWAAHNGVDTTVFRPRVAGRGHSGRYETAVDGGNGSRRVEHDNGAFRRLAGLDPETPYVMIVGTRRGYKNARAVYHALGRAADPYASTTATSESRASAVPALVLVGGGPVVPEELDILAEVRQWSHIGTGSRVPLATATAAGGGGLVAVDDDLLAAGYAGAVALLHLSLAEGFGLTVLEAFACGCPVVAADIPPVREIAGLPDLEGAGAAWFEEESKSVAAAAPRHGTEERNRPPTKSGETLPAGRGTDRYQGAVSSLEGGLVLVENPSSVTQIWRAVRAVTAMGVERRLTASEALVRRAKAFDSWQPLADTLIKAAVE